jgi:hypothetical protein
MYATVHDSRTLGSLAGLITLCGCRVRPFGTPAVVRVCFTSQGRVGTTPIILTQKRLVRFLPQIHIGRAPERRVPGNLFGREAAQLAKDIEAKLVVPCHFAMFEFNSASTDEFVNECRKLEQQFRVLRCGERWHSWSSIRLA